MAPRQSRFQASIPPVRGGVSKGRSKNYVKHCGKGSRKNSGWDHDKKVVRQCGPGFDAFITAYCGNALYKSVNEALSNDDEEGLRQHGQYIHGLRVAMLRRIRRGKNVRSGVVYRWMNLDPDKIAKYTVGFKFLWPNFVSTSRKSDVWTGNVRFEIDLNGRGTTYAIDVSDLSPYKHEAEVLLYPFSGFEVKSTRVANNIQYIRLMTCDTLHIDSFFGQDDMNPASPTAVIMA